MSFLDKLNSPKAVAVVLVFCLTLNGFLFYHYQQSLQSTGNNAINAQTEAIEKTTTSPEDQKGVQVAVSVANDAPVGLSIYEDGTLVHDQVNNPGFYEEFDAEDSITIAAADSRAVLVGVDGENLQPLGESGEGAIRTFTNESES